MKAFMMHKLITFHVKVLLVFLLTVITGGPGLRAQDMARGPSDPPGIMEYISRAHGPDQELINGIQYYNPHYRVTGHPYLMGEEAFPGSLYLSGKTYEGLQLHYDIYDQHLVLDYRTKFGGINKIILSPIRIESFSLDGFGFRKLNLDKNGPLYYQVIRAGELTCYVHWRKGLIPNRMDLRSLGDFTLPIRTYYLDKNGCVQSFSNRGSFAALFPVEARKEIKRFMRINRIRFRKADPRELTTLIEYVYTLLPETSEEE